MARYVQVPHDALSAEALAGLVEEFVTREGTDYGLTEHTLAQKSAAIMRQLERGEVLICFDVESESATLVRSEELSPSRK